MEGIVKDKRFIRILLEWRWSAMVCSLCTKVMWELSDCKWKLLGEEEQISWGMVNLKPLQQKSASASVPGLNESKWLLVQVLMTLRRKQKRKWRLKIIAKRKKRELSIKGQIPNKKKEQSKHRTNITKSYQELISAWFTQILHQWETAR